MTLSPRLHVKNGIKIGRATGPLVDAQAVEELYQAGWRPPPVVDQAPPFRQIIPPVPQWGYRCSNIPRSILTSTASLNRHGQVLCLGHLRLRVNRDKGRKVKDKNRRRSRKREREGSHCLLESNDTSRFLTVRLLSFFHWSNCATRA